MDIKDYSTLHLEINTSKCLKEQYFYCCSTFHSHSRSSKCSSESKDWPPHCIARNGIKGRIEKCENISTETKNLIDLAIYINDMCIIDW